MSLLWKQAQFEYHTSHQVHPMLAKAGIGESPCGYADCPHYDEDHADAMDRAYDAKGKFMLLDTKNSKLNGMESHINPDTVEAYRKATPPKKSLPKVFTHKGQHHILDGHHRLIADSLEGRVTPILHSNLDEEH